MEPRPVAHSLSVLVHWLGPTDLNSAGFVHGGVIMKLCDQVAGLAGVRHSGGRVVTAGMDRMTFNEPIHIGELLTLRAAVNAVWRTSMEVGVRVEAESPLTGERRHTNSAYITLVAVDEDGHPAAAVPPLRCARPEESRREREAQVRRANRLAEREQLIAHREAEEPAQPA
jgi:acyl-CoA hydrolase